MKQRKFVLPSDIRERAEALAKLAQLTTARNAETISKITSDGLPAIAATERVSEDELTYLLARAQQVIEDIKVFVVNSRPPINAEFVLYLFLGREERDAVIGDLIQDYGRILQRFGQRHADIWFYTQVIGSVWPFVRRALFRLGTFVWIGKLLRRLSS